MGNLLLSPGIRILLKLLFTINRCGCRLLDRRRMNEVVFTFSLIAENLRENGVDAWLDRWEIKPGDSLVQRIFDEGIKTAQVFIIVLSSNAVISPWVREELDSGMVAKIQKSTRLIPVLIDDCDVPHALKNVMWVKIKNLDDYKTELSEILSSIFGTDNRPPIGNPPVHAKATVLDFVPDLTKADLLILEVLCRHYLRTASRYIAFQDVSADLASLGLSDKDIYESIEIMASRGNLKADRGGMRVYFIEIYTATIDLYLQAICPEYFQQLTTVISEIVNAQLDTTTALQEKTGIPMPVVLHFVNLLEKRGLLNSAGPAGLPARKITRVSAELKRLVRQ